MAIQRLPVGPRLGDYPIQRVAHVGADILQISNSYISLLASYHLAWLPDLISHIPPSHHRFPSAEG
jgi:hypothetical protein